MKFPVHFKTILIILTFILTGSALATYQIAGQKINHTSKNLSLSNTQVPSPTPKKPSSTPSPSVTPTATPKLTRVQENKNTPTPIPTPTFISTPTPTPQPSISVFQSITNRIILSPDGLGSKTVSGEVTIKIESVGGHYSGDPRVRILGFNLTGSVSGLNPDKDYGVSLCRNSMGDCNRVIVFKASSTGTATFQGGSGLTHDFDNPISKIRIIQESDNLNYLYYCNYPDSSCLIGNFSIPEELILSVN